MRGRIYRPERTQTVFEFPEVGRLHIGIKALKNGREYPQAIDYFRPTGKYADLFTQALGEKPSVLQIVFPSDDASLVCNERYEYRSDKGELIARGDGTEFEVWNAQKTCYEAFGLDEFPDLMSRIVTRYPTKRGADNWDITLTLRFLIPAVRSVIGVWQFTTKAKASSIENIRNSFDAIQQMRGTVMGTVFDLSVEFAKSNKPGVASRYPVVSLIANDNNGDTIRQQIQERSSSPLLLTK